MDTKFAKASILGKPPLQPSRNHSVVRQPNAFKSERPRISKPWVASQVDVKHNLPKPVTPHYFPKVRESAPTKLHHVNAPSSSRNSKKESYGSNDMAHNHYLEEARKKTQERNRNSSFFSDSKHFVCSTCQKCVFNVNHDDCITNFLKEVNSRAKVQSPKTRTNNKPVQPKSHTQKPGRQIAIGQMFSLNKSFAVHEKPYTPRSCLSEPPNGSTDDITNIYECDQTLYFSACTFNTSASTSVNPIKERLRLPIGKGNLLLDLQKLQKNPIFRISVDILQNTNFFRAFTASANLFTLNVDLLHAETGADSEKTNSQAGSDPGKTPESQPSSEHELIEEDQAGSNPRQNDVALVGPNPEPIVKNKKSLGHFQ
ncbi:hypothetical protein Tco_0670635 [Tanacetum coccineum]